MYIEISDQFKEAIRHNNAEEISKTLIRAAVTQEATIVDISTDLGFCYCMENSGLGKFKPSNILYFYHALQHQDGCCFGLKWRSLEFLTSMLFSSGAKLVAKGPNNTTIDFPRVHRKVLQEKLGDLLPHPHSGVVLHEMAYGHNVIDFVMYDMRATANATIFFVQVSSSPYSSKKKKKEDLKDVVKDGTVLLTKLPICSHYKNLHSVTFNQQVYIYATTNLTGWNRHEGVYFLNLLEFSPTDLPNSPASVYREKPMFKNQVISV